MTNLSASNFDSEVTNFQGLVLVDFWAPWCQPCLRISPVLEEIANDLKEKTNFKIVKLNTDDEMELSQKFQIMSIPNMKFFKNGQVVGEIVGVMPKEVILEKINSLLV